ncbi:hypothetical protein [Aquimarina sp. AU119]|uniref:hypothetical protein n=1 Tax=Aquimarina sp. AU119 TaxID=2108528 RepID=UPI000D69C1BD|nr:hypothetical protein [Aquimarina sp. AU119]
MRFSEFKDAVEDAERTIKQADEMVEKIIPMIPNRLRNINSWPGIEALRAIKKELKNFNSVTGKWK